LKQKLVVKPHLREGFLDGARVGTFLAVGAGLVLGSMLGDSDGFIDGAALTVGAIVTMEG
jgi:hypothetical protein